MFLLLSKQQNKIPSCPISTGFGGSGRRNTKKTSSFIMSRVTIDGSAPQHYVEYDPLLDSGKGEATDLAAAGLEGVSNINDGNGGFARSEHLHVNALALILKRRRAEKRKVMQKFSELMELQVDARAVPQTAVGHSLPNDEGSTRKGSAQIDDVSVPLIFSPKLHPSHTHFSGKHRFARTKHKVTSIPDSCS